MHTRTRTNATTPWWQDIPVPMWIASALLAITMAAVPAFAVDVHPKRIVFEDLATSKTIQISHDGAAVPASAIGEVKFYASGNDYDHMINVSKADGAVTITPSDKMEVGSYDLVIHTNHGKATVYVMAPLDELYTSLESRAKRLGITKDALKARLGLTERLGKEFIDLNIPKVYYVGQTATFPIDRVKGRTYTWSVNGMPIEFGKGSAHMSYTFTEPGIYDFGYVELKDGEVVAEGFGSTTVVSEPAVHLRVDADTPQKFMAPDGFAHYTWAVDGKEMGENKTLTHKFSQKGSHVVTVHAHTPLAGTVEALREITYVVTVT